MKDQVTLDRIELLHPDLRQETHAIYDEICAALTKNVICRFAYTLRSFQFQDELYAQGRTKLFDKNGKRLGIVTNARGGQSYHNYGLAIDIVLLIDKDSNGSYEAASWDIKADSDKDTISDWDEISKIFVRYGWQYLTKNGKRWDYPHYQKTMGKSVKQLHAMYLAQGKPEYIKF